MARYDVGLGLVGVGMSYESTLMDKGQIVDEYNVDLQFLGLLLACKSSIVSNGRFNIIK